APGADFHLPPAGGWLSRPAPRDEVLADPPQPTAPGPVPAVAPPDADRPVPSLPHPPARLRAAFLSLGLVRYALAGTGRSPRRRCAGRAGGKRLSLCTSSTWRATSASSGRARRGGPAGRPASISWWTRPTSPGTVTPRRGFSASSAPQGTRSCGWRRDGAWRASRPDSPPRPART